MNKMNKHRNRYEWIIPLILMWMKSYIDNDVDHKKHDIYNE